jgi:heme-degrading monooxygenase HmoA
MHASLLTFRFQPGQRDEFIRISEEQVIPEIKQFKGLQRAYLLTDPVTDTVVVVGVYETEADARAVESSGLFRQVAVRHASHIIVPESMERHVYEVSLQVVADEAREMGA